MFAGSPPGRARARHLWRCMEDEGPGEDDAHQVNNVMATFAGGPIDQRLWMMQQLLHFMAGMLNQIAQAVDVSQGDVDADGDQDVGQEEVEACKVV